MFSLVSFYPAAVSCVVRHAMQYIPTRMFEVKFPTFHKILKCPVYVKCRLFSMFHFVKMIRQTSATFHISSCELSLGWGELILTIHSTNLLCSAEASGCTWRYSKPQSLRDYKRRAKNHHNFPAFKFFQHSKYRFSFRDRLQKSKFCEAFPPLLCMPELNVGSLFLSYTHNT